MPRAATIVVQTVNYPCLRNREYHYMNNYFGTSSTVKLNESKVKLFYVDVDLKRLEMILLPSVGLSHKINTIKRVSLCRRNFTYILVNIYEYLPYEIGNDYSESS